MIRHHILFLLILSAFTSKAQRTPFTYTDMLLLDRISGLSVDTAGRFALFTVRATDMERNKGVRSLWLKDLSDIAKPEVRLPVSDGGADGARWSPNGQHMYFLSARGEGGTMQIWRCDPSGKEPEQMTRLPLDVGSFQLMPDNRSAVISLAVVPEGKDEIATTVARNAEKRTGSGTVYERVFVRHWDTWKDGTRNHLFHVRFVDAAVTALTPGFDGDVPSMPFGDEGDYCIAPDGKTVYFSGREAGTNEPWSTNFDVYSVPVEGGGLTNLTPTNKAWDASPRMSPDGRTLAYKAMARPGFEADRFVVRLLDPNTGTSTPLAPDWDRSVEQMEWSADGTTLLVTADDMGTHRLFRMDPGTREVVALSKDGHMDAFSETAQGFVFLKSAMNSPSKLYRGRSGIGVGVARTSASPAFIDDGAIDLTRVNSGLAKKEFGAYEQFSFAGWNNETVHGYVVKPAGYVEGQKYPVAFLIHGGPQGSFGDMWSYRWNAMTYAGAGYAVVMIDFHGSTGYGQAFCDAISQHWGDRPLEDLQKGWAYALNKYPFLDADRAAALGASYGGFMVNWIAGNWKAPWKCLVSHDGVFDARSMGYTTEEMWFELWEQGASPYTDPAVYDTFNPALHVQDWSVPMLVIHSDRDYRIPVEQGIAAFTALQAKSIASQFLRFPDENHWVMKPQNSMQWHNTVFSWLGRWTGGGK